MAEAPVDVIVVGAGFAGLCAAAAAAESGARTILIEKGARPSYRGLRVGAVGNKAQKAAGIEVDPEDVIEEIMRWGGYKADRRLVSLWAHQSGAVMDWVYDEIADAGLTPSLVPIEDQVKDGTFRYFPITNLGLEGGQETLAGVLERACLRRGVEFRFKASVQSLVATAGRVEGVVLDEANGQETILARRGVILCTGDYGSNREMVETWAPQAAKAFASCYDPPHNTGDGHRMGLEVGAVMQDGPHASLIFDVIVLDSHEPIMVPLTRQPFLNVNARGERYVNEDLPFAYLCNADMAQPGGFKWVVWDAKWRQDAARFASIICKALKPPLHDDAVVDRYFETGVIKTAQTLDALADQMQVPPTSFLTTVDRYNTLAQRGHDEDFGKRSQCLSTIEQAPFHAVRMGPGLLVTLGGLKIDTQLRVLDSAGAPIPGLYAAGNVSGDFFANDYPINVSGVSHGRAITFGRLAGQSAAAVLEAAA